LNSTGQAPIVQAGVTAKIRAVLQGPERGILVLGILFLLVFLFSISIDAVNPGLLTKVGGYVGLGALIALLMYWFFGGKGSEAPEMAMTTVSATPQEWSVSTPSRDSHQVLTLIREMLHNRQPLPAPHGSVKDRTPETAAALKEYSEEEREQVLESLNQELESHDKQVMDQIRETEKLLPSKTEDEESIPGAQQLSDEVTAKVSDPKAQKKDEK